MTTPSMTDSDGLAQPDEPTKPSHNQADNPDLVALAKIRDILNEFYPEVREAMLKYCLFVTEKDLEA